MKLNKKGSSLLELIISIALIAVVMVFLVKLLVDLNNKETNNVYAKDNQVNRAQIIRTIENDIENKVITNINSNGSTTEKLIINFIFDDNTTSTITATEDKLTYKSSENKTRKWTIKGGEIYTNCAKINMSNDYSKETGTKIYSISIDIEIHTTNDKNTTFAKKSDNTITVNNTLDDIIISHYGKSTNTFPSNKFIHLGNNC